MATINYLPSFPISDRVFPCPRKHMLIYGQKPPSPPPATLTQEQLARDAGQLVEAHVLLDKLCDDTDRSQHSLVHRLKQIVYGSEEMNKVLEKAGFNTAAGLLECVRALAQRQKTTKETLDQVEARALGYQLEITRLKERNKRLHDAQGSGNGAAADLKVVRDTLREIANQRAEIKRLRAEIQAAGDVLNKELAITKGGSLPVRIQRLIDQVREGSTNRSLILMVQQAHGHMNEAGVALEGDLNIEQRVKALIEERNLYQREAGKDPALDRMVQEAHQRLHLAGVEPRCGTIVERVEALIAERDLLKSDTFSVLRGKVQAAHRKLNTVEQVSTLGTIDERVASLVDLLKARVASVSVPPEYDKRYHEKLNELPEIERTGTLLERVTQVVDLFKARGAVLDEIRGHLIRACQTLRVSNPAGMHTTGLAQTVNEELARSPRITLARIPSIKLVDECFRLLDKAGIPNGTLCERVRVAIERGQQAKVAPDAAHCVKIVEECTRKLTQADVPTGNLLDRIQLLINDRAALLQSKTSYGVSPTLDEKAWEVRNRDNRVMAICTSLADAQRIRASLEAR